MGSGGRDGRDNAFIAAGGVAMLTASGTAVITLYVNKVDLWPNPVLIACAAFGLLGLYLFSAVVFSWPLPGSVREAHKPDLPLPGQPAYVYWDGATYGPEEARDWPYQRRFSGPVNPNEVPGWHMRTGDVWERDA